MEVSLGAEGGRIGLHCVHLAVQGPSGQEVPHYAQNLLLPGGRGKAGIPFAYNEEPGTWTVTAREVLTGRTARWRVGCRSR